MPFTPVARRGLFCDGFSYPKKLYHSYKQAAAALEVHNIDVKFISPKASRGFHFAMLAEDDHDLPELVSKFRGMFRSRRPHAMQLRSWLDLGHSLMAAQQPHLGKIDLTQDVCGFFYVKGDWACVAEQLSHELSRLLARKLAVGRNSFSSCLYFEEPEDHKRMTIRVKVYNKGL
jgi:hypothetical protein